MVHFVRSSRNAAGQVNTNKGITVPQGWGANWYQALANRGNQLVPIAVWGDSIYQGYYTSSLVNNSVPGLLRQKLQSMFGNGGSGFLTAANNNQSPLTPGVNDGFTGSGIAGDWSHQSGGYNEFVLVNTQANGHTLTAQFNGTILDVYFVGPTTAFSIGVTVDGVAQTAITSPTAAVVHQATYTGFAPGNHTVVLTGTTGNMLITGIRGRNASGIIVDNQSAVGRTSQAGAVSTYWSTGNSGSQAFFSGFNGQPPTVAIYCIGANDIVGSTYDTFNAGVNRMLWNAATQGVTDIIIVIEPYPYTTAGVVSDGNFIYGKFVSALYTLARMYNAAVLDYCGGYQQASWTNWFNAGYYGVPGGTTGAAGNDGVHTSNLGSQVLSEGLVNLLGIDLPVSAVPIQ